MSVVLSRASPMPIDWMRKMRPRIFIGVLLGCAVIGMLLSSWIPTGYTRIELTEGGSGERILSVVVPCGERITLTWRNSQFGLAVTEVFFAKGGVLVQDQVTFAAPGGPPPPRVSALDVADLYHTGGAFDARGLGRPFSRIVYRIGEVGDPKIRVQNKIIALKAAAGFGGRVILTAARPALHEIIFRRRPVPAGPEPPF